MSDNTPKQSTVLQPDYQPIQTGQWAAPTWSIIVLLVIVFIVLKYFIYIKDEKRDGK